MNQRVSGTLLLLLLVAACQSAQQNGGVVGDDAITRVLRARGEAPVMVALVPPPGLQDASADRDRVRADIARVQAEVIAALDTADFRNPRMFSNIPSLSVTLRAERGLRTLQAHPHVVGVTLDPSGGGSH